MAKLPSPAELAPVVVDVLKDLGGSAHFKDIEKAVAIKLNLTRAETSQIRTGKRTEFSYRLSWARTKCKADGLLANTGKGIWTLTK